MLPKDSLKRREGAAISYPPHGEGVARSVDVGSRQPGELSARAGQRASGVLGERHGMRPQIAVSRSEPRPRCGVLTTKHHALTSAAPGACRSMAAGSTLAQSGDIA